MKKRPEEHLGEMWRPQSHSEVTECTWALHSEMLALSGTQQILFPVHFSENLARLWSITTTLKN
jgi:hypothetical protein